MYELSHAIRTFIIWIFIISITGIPCNVRADENHDVLAAVHDAEIVRNATEKNTDNGERPKCRQMWTGCGKFIDMIIVVDGPADYVQFKTLQAALLKFVDNMQLAIDKVRLGFIIQSGSYKTTSVGLSSNAANLRTALSKLQMPSDGKRTDLAIKEMKVMFRSSSRESSTRVGVVIINGNSQYPTQTAKRSAFARHDGIIMFAVGVGKNIDRSELKSIATFLTPIFEPETYTDLFYSVESYSKVFCVTPQQYGLQATIVLQGPETTETSSAETSTDQTPTVTTPATQTAHPELLRVCRDFINSHGPGYINHHTDCNKYIKCSMSTGGNVRADVKVCSLGKFWSTTTSRCEDSSKVECMQDPCVYARGMVSSYANPDNCRAFWKCGENTTPKCCAANHKYMRGQGCVTDYDGTCNMLCSLNDQSAGASPTVQRAPSKVPESSDLTTSANQATCMKRPDSVDKTKYEVYVGSMVWKKESCEVGTEYSQDLCICTPVKSAYTPVVSNVSPTVSEVIEPDVTKVSKTGCNRRADPMDKTKYLEYTTSGWVKETCKMGSEYNDAMCDCSINPTPMGYPSGQPSVTYGLHSPPVVTQSEIPKSSAPSACDKMVVSLDHSKYGVHDSLSGYQEKSCPLGREFDPKTCLCSTVRHGQLPTTPIDLAQVCSSKLRHISGYIGDPTDSTKYIKCSLQPDQTYIASSEKCLFGKFWDEPSMSCLDSHITKSAYDPCVIAEGMITSYSYRENCRAYFQCGQSTHVMCCDVGMKYVEERGCVTDTDNSCRQDCPPKTIGNNAGCMKRPHAMDRYKYEEYMGVLGWQIKPCDTGEEYSQEACNCSPVKQILSHSPVCNRRAVTTDKTRYEEYMAVYGWQMRTCATGEVYNDVICRCTQISTSQQPSSADQTQPDLTYGSLTPLVGSQPKDYAQECATKMHLSSGYLPDPTDSTKYIKCTLQPDHTYIASSISCTFGQVWDAPSMSCLDSSITSNPTEQQKEPSLTYGSPTTSGVSQPDVTKISTANACDKTVVSSDPSKYGVQDPVLGYREKSCPFGREFNQYTCLCSTVKYGRPPSHIDYAQECATKMQLSSGYLPDPTDSTKYIKCSLQPDHTYIASSISCTFGKFWDVPSMSCLDSHITSNPYDLCVIAEGMITSYSYRENCRAYFQCGQSTHVMCCDAGMKYVEERGCVTDTDNSCRQDCPPKTTGNKISGCDKRPNTLDNTKYEVYIVSRGWQPMSCDPGTEYNQEVCSCSPVKLSYTPGTSGCDKRPNTLDATKYEVYIVSHGWQPRSCDPGTEYNQEACACSPVKLSYTPGTSGCDKRPYTLDNTKYEVYIVSRGWQLMPCAPGTEYSQEACGCAPMKLSHTLGTSGCNKKAVAYDSVLYEEYVDYVGWQEHACNQGYHYVHELCNCAPTGSATAPSSNTKVCDKKPVDTDKGKYLMADSTGTYMERRCPTGKEFDPNTCLCSIIVPYPVNTTVGCTKRPFRGDITKYQEREGTKWVDRSCEPSHLYNNDMCQCSPIHTFIASTGNFDLNRVCVLSEMEHGAGFSSHPSDCTKYLRCTVQLDKSILAEVMECPFKQFWDQSILSCVESHKVYCKQDPCVISNGRITSYGNADNCRSYWECGRRTRGKCCAGGHMYKEGVGCVPDLNNMCGTSCPPKVKKNNFECDKRTYSRDTSRYEQMMQGFGYVKLRCAPGTLFDQPTCGCSKYAPYNSPTELNKDYATEEESRIACQGCKMSNGAGFNNHPYDCTRYVQCFQQPDSSFRAKFRDCPYGMFWDQDILSCQESHRVKCATDPCMLIKGKKRYADADNCKGYWECTPDGTYPLCCAEGKVYLEGRGCIRDKTKLCNNTCPPEDVYATEKKEKEECHKKAIPNNKQKYIQWIKGHGDIEMDCPYGTEYSTFNCLCITITSIASHAGRPDTVKAPKMCEADLRLEFNNGLHDSSGKWTYVNNQGVTFDNGTAYFDGKSRLLIPQYTNADFGNTFVMRIRYKGTGIYAEPGSLQALINNGDCGDDGTVQIFTSQKEIGFSVKTKPRTDKVSFKVPKPATEWKNVEYEFINNRLEGKVNGVSGGVGWSEGDIEARHCALQIGFGFGYQNFVGYVDTLEVYRCKPETPMVWI